MAISTVSSRGTVGGADFYVACFTWFEDGQPFCQVDYGLSLSQMLDRAEAWVRSGREFPGAEIWLGLRRCIFLMGESGCEPDEGGEIGFPRQRGIYRWDDGRQSFVGMRRREGRAALRAEGLGPA